MLKCFKETYGSGSSGNRISVAAGLEGWYAFEIHSRDTPSSDPKLSFKLIVDYTAPRDSTSI